VCFVVSDFLDANFEEALRTANRKHDVIAVLITDPSELELPGVGISGMDDPFVDRFGIGVNGRHAMISTAVGSAFLVRLDGKDYASTAAPARSLTLPDLVEELRGVLDAWAATVTAGSGELDTSSMDPELLDRLRALGYLK